MQHSLSARPSLNLLILYPTLTRLKGVRESGLQESAAVGGCAASAEGRAAAAALPSALKPDWNRRLFAERVHRTPTKAAAVAARINVAMATAPKRMADEVAKATSSATTATTSWAWGRTIWHASKNVTMVAMVALPATSGPAAGPSPASSQGALVPRPSWASSPAVAARRCGGGALAGGARSCATRSSWLRSLLNLSGRMSFRCGEELSLLSI